MKKWCWKLAVLICVCLTMFVFVACKEDDSGSTVGLVYSVSFDSGVEGVVIESQAVEAGNLVVEPLLGLREGFVLVGWKNGDNWWNFKSHVVNSNIDLKAIWEPDTVNWNYTEGLNFAYNETLDGYVVSSYTGSEANVVVPMYYSGDSGIKLVKEIGVDAFKNNRVINKVDTGAGVTIIQDGAFCGSSLASFVVRSEIEKIGKSAFKAENGFESNLVSVEFKGGDKKLEIGDDSFIGTKLNSIVFPSRLEKVGARAFSGVDLTSVKFPGASSNIEYIGQEAFAGIKVTNLYLNSLVKEICTGAFKDISSLETIVFPSGLEKVGTGLFEGCVKLKGIFYSNLKPTVLNKNSSWKGTATLEYEYSSVPKVKCWRLNNESIPTPYVNNIEISVDATSVELLKLGEYCLVVSYSVPILVGQYAPVKQVVNLDAGGLGKFYLDSFAVEEFVVEVYESGYPSKKVLVANSLVITELEDIKLMEIDEEQRRVLIEGVS